MEFLMNTLRDATSPLLAEPIALACLVLFTVWAGVFDIKTLKITNRFNQVFFLTGWMFMAIGFVTALPSIIPSLSLGWTNVAGMIAGFLILFIPAFFKNHPMGGDIKMTAVLGFWIGLEPMIFVLLVGVAANALYWMGAFSIWKEYGSKTLMPFAPFFALGVLVVYGVGALI